MPKKRSKKKTPQARPRTEQKLRAAEAQIKRLQRQNRDCTCVPLTPEEQDKEIREFVDLINSFPPSAFDPEKARARGRPFPPEKIILPEDGLFTWP